MFNQLGEELDGGDDSKMPPVLEEEAMPAAARGERAAAWSDGGNQGRGCEERQR